jgi:phage baseplate assembly protein W
MADTNAYASDLDINFERNLFTGDVTLKTGDDAIRRALKNLIFLKANEKPFHPEINSGIIDLLFENGNPMVLEEVKRRVREAILRYEPRVSDLAVNMEYNIDRNLVMVKILYTIKNSQQVFTTSMSLQRTR